MKLIILFTASIALLRATAAYLPHRGGPDYRGKLVQQPGGDYHHLVSDLASSSDYVEFTEEAQSSTYPPSAHSLYQPTRLKEEMVEEDEEEEEGAGEEEPSPSHHFPSTTAATANSDFQVGTTTAQWAIVYHPYNDDSTCRSKATVHAHMALIAAKGFTTIRLHNHDCSLLSKLASSPHILSHSIRLILGIHIDETGLSPANPLVDEVVTWVSADPSRWEMVELVVVGEEAVFNGHCSAPALATFITSTRRTLRNAGYSGPVTITEPLHVLYEASDVLCPVLDILASNIHPFFHAEVSASTAGAYVRDSLDVLEAICPGLKGVNLETGWPHRGISNGEAVPSPEEQEVAIEGIRREAGGRSVVLGFGDDGWMEEGEFGVEGSWGCEGLFPGGEEEEEVEGDGEEVGR